MSTRILVTLFILFIGSTISFTQSKTAVQKNDLQSLKSIQQTDSVYYSCVPCCQPCSVYTTDKPGECPHCGMTLEKRTYQADKVIKAENIPANNNACKPPKAKKN